MLKMPVAGVTNNQYLSAACMCLGGFTIGNAMGWTSNISEALEDGEMNELDIDQQQLSWAASLLTLGATFICIPIGWMIDIVGRKYTVLLFVIPFSLGWLMTILASYITLLYCGRFLIGVSCGVFSISAPLYISEVAHFSIRGTLGTFYQLFFTLGIFISGLLGYGLPLTAFNVACFFTPILFGIFFIFQPESPVFDLKHGNTEKAFKTLNSFRGEGYDVDEEIKEKLENIESEKYLWERIKQKSTINAIYICVMLMCYQQLCGINAVLFYAQEMFDEAGSKLEASHCVILLQSIQLAATLISTFTVDRFGRRILLMLSAGFMALSTGFLGVFYSLQEQNKSSAFFNTVSPLICLNVFIVAYSIGLGPIPWIAWTEMLPPEVKTKLGSIIVCFMWFLAFCVTKFYFDVSWYLGRSVTFFIFTLISTTAIFFACSAIPETKGKTFAEIQELLEV